MQHYLWILKTTHSGADMDTSMEMAKGSLDDGLRWTIFDILKNRQAPLLDEIIAGSRPCIACLVSANGETAPCSIIRPWPVLDHQRHPELAWQPQTPGWGGKVEDGERHQ